MKIFLSASIPDPKRHEKYFGTADILAIRDAVRALATVVLPRYQLVWGGHPAITPLIRYVMDQFAGSLEQRVFLYQSEFFKFDFPPVNDSFQKVIEVPKEEDREKSLLRMRKQMLEGDKHQFIAGIFIGGMEGVEDEFQLFRKIHPHVPFYPIASTGAAARIVYEESGMNDKLLIEEYAYMSLFHTLFPENLKGEGGGA